MKRKIYINATTLILLASLCFASIPVQAVVLNYQCPDTSTDKAVDCEVYYDTCYDFTIIVPKDKPEDKLGVTAGNYTGIYDGEPHGIVVLCEALEAVISYSTDGGRTYTSERPVYTEVGTYITYFKVEGIGEGVTGSATVKIQEASIDYAASDYSGLYDGKNHGINFTVYTEGCEVLYSTDGVTYSSEKPTYKDPGTYATYYRIIKDNYETAEGSNKVIIGTHTIEYTATDWIGKYDGKPHAITVNVSTDECEILYSTDGINYIYENPAYTEVGTYVTYFRIIREGYETVEGRGRIDIKEININLSDTSGIVKVNDSIDFTVDTDGIPLDVTVLDPSIVKVSVKDGVVTVTGLKEGKTTILITCNDKTAEYEITVTDNHIILSDTKGSVKVDDFVDFTVDTDGEPFDVAVSDPSVAKVTIKDGVVTVTGLKEGKTAILITSNGKTVEYEITVTDTHIKLSDVSGTVKVDDSIKFTVDTGGESFDVAVSDPSIAKVTVKNGVITVTGLRAGTATIIITCDDKSATYKVTVIDTSNNTSVNISNDSKDVINNSSDNKSNVQTGDGNHILLYGAMLIGSVFGLMKNRNRKGKRRL